MFDLNDLVSGREEHVSLTEPVAFLYEHYGYWPAMLCFPIIGIIVVLLGIRKIHTLKLTVQKN